MSPSDIDFFTDAVITFSSSLDIEKALHRCFRYIRNFMPVDKIFLGYYDNELQSIINFVSATSRGGLLHEVKCPLPSEGQFKFKSITKPAIFLANNPARHPVAKFCIDMIGKNSSAIVMHLVLEKKFIGGFVICVEGLGQYNKKHVMLLEKLNKPFSIAFLNSLRYRELLLLKESLSAENIFLKQKLREKESPEIIGKNSGLKHVMDLVKNVAPLECPVLLLGETGTGKEIFAEAIQTASYLRNRPFIKVNCGAIPYSLIDSELFGYEKGAFTGASFRKEGYFERANSGTIFLDEVGELPLEAQVRLLRVIQNNEIMRIGGAKPINVNIRIILATHRDLEAMVRNGTFREDLYYRINVFPIEIPPLRDRKEDIPNFIRYFLRKTVKLFNLKTTPMLTTENINELNLHSWPGNVRELENLVQRALILSNEGKNPFYIKIPSHSNNIENPDTFLCDLSLDAMMAKHVKKVLKLTGGRIQGPKGAASLLGIQPNTLRARMKKMEIPYGKKAKKLSS